MSATGEAEVFFEKLERQIRKHKTKLARRFREAGFREEVVKEELSRREAEEEPLDYPVVKKKRFVVKPMDVQEAIMEMNLLNHNFFVFRDSETEAVNVVYRRNDGNYGLIESNN